MDPPDLKNASEIKEELSTEESGSWTILGKRSTSEDGSGVQIVDYDSEKEDQEPAVVDQAEISSKSRWNAESQLDESSDGISVISESDIVSGDKIVDQEDDPTPTLHFTENLNLSSTYEPLTPPYTPTSASTSPKEFKENALQVQKTGDENALERIQSVVPRSLEPVSNVKWIVFSVLATAMAAVILGNSMRLKGRVDEINFEHEKRISELELENNILKQEMNKLRHMYTRSELDEQVQRAEFEWQERLRNSEPADLASEDAAPQPEVRPQSEPIRKVPPQDTGVKRKVVWSGDEEEPMLIVDKDFVLPAFCYNQDRAVQDDLFFEYSAKYCDVKKRKIEAKQKKAEFKEKHQPKQDNYNKYINIKPNQQQPNDANAGDNGRLASPFNIDYQKAFDAIKAEGSVIVEALGSILDLSPEPEPMLSAKIVESVEPPVETITTIPDMPQPKSPGTSEGDHRPQDAREYQKPAKPGHDERREDYRKKEEQQRKSREYGGEREKYYQKEEKGKGKGDGRKEDGYDKRKQKYENNGQKRYHGSGEEHSGEQERRKMHQNGKSNEQHYKKRSHDKDDHDKDYRKKFDGEKHGDHGSGRHGSGEHYRRKHWESEEGSYLEQYKRDEYRKDKRFDRDEERYHQQKKHDDDWNGKRYKGREEYRGKREGERGSGHWQERMKDGRQEARDSQRRKAEKESNWYLERANQREEDRIFQQT
ncbi:trichohyalin-like [Anopheles darlingi]|uniref:trichohyalin-like n=1 Tax=Anopheles darlingi TaxID=43151 RepID=UPI0020FFFA14|nr:trichohyalin-like [Anopheles darlingi]XP_049548651.1 trichohyalin-like [Anopheles darlingi]